MIYATKFRLVNYALILAVIGIFGVIGTHATSHLFAQTPPPSGVSFVLSQPTYKVGDDVVVLVSNTSDTNYYVLNNCPDEPLKVSKFENGDWIPIAAAAPESRCAGQPTDYELPANHSVPVDYKYWPSLFSQPGVYEIQAQIEPSQQGPAVTFSVTK